MANYPNSVPSFTNKSAGQTIASAHINAIQDEVVAIGAGLLQGTAQLNSSNSTVANLSVGGGSTLGNAIAQSISVSGGSTLAASVVMSGAVSITLAQGDNDDLASTAFATAAMIRLSANSSGSTLTGLAGGAHGRILFLANAAVPAVGLKNDAGSVAQNRLQMKSNSDTSLQYSIFIYDSGANRWLQFS